jgi:4-hydroxy-tetrahydrodipicolinate reductase
MSHVELRILIHGASGRMGRALCRLAPEVAGIAGIVAISRAEPADRGSTPWLPTSALDQAPDSDAMIDFSTPEGFDAALRHCVERRIAFVTGTTGLSASQFAALDAAATRIPVLWAANFSLGVAVLEALVARAAAALPHWDCDLIETHHIHKRDAPSGTALVLGQAVRNARGGEPHYASLRAGDIVGEHTVQFAGQGERLELTHRATSRDIFARGALECALRLAARGPGRRSIGDLLLGTD